MRMMIPNWIILAGMGLVFALAAGVGMTWFVLGRTKEKQGFPVEPPQKDR